MIARVIAFAAACTMAATPCLSAELPNYDSRGERHSGAMAGAYFRIALSPGKGVKPGPQAGFRLAMTHDYRTASAPGASLVQADALDLRLTGNEKPTLYLAGRPVTGKEAQKMNMSTAGTIALVGVGVLLLVVVAYGTAASDLSNDIH